MQINFKHHLGLMTLYMCRTFVIPNASKCGGRTYTHTPKNALFALLNMLHENQKKNFFFFCIFDDELESLIKWPNEQTQKKGDLMRAPA